LIGVVENFPLPVSADASKTATLIKTVRSWFGKTPRAKQYLAFIMLNPISRVYTNANKQTKKTGYDNQEAQTKYLDSVT
jgi:hypothetical protein